MEALRTETLDLKQERWNPWNLTAFPELGFNMAHAEQQLNRKGLCLLQYLMCLVIQTTTANQISVWRSGRLSISESVRLLWNIIWLIKLISYCSFNRTEFCSV